jgi:hypothetical protein
VLAILTEKVETDTISLLSVDQSVQSILEPDEIHLIEVALKDAILHPLTEVFQRFEDAATTLVVYDVVRNYNEHPSIPYEVS